MTPYPPGIPVLAPGDVISRQNIDFPVESGKQGRGNDAVSGVNPRMTEVMVR